MNLVKWNPWNEMATFQNRLNRFFDAPLFPALRGGEEPPLSAWNPAVDIFENDESIVIKAELPGVGKEDIQVDIKDRVLTLKGERNSENEVKEENYYRRERIFGRFERSFTIPAGVDAEEISADFKDGVLKIAVPKPEQSKPKQISIH